MEMVKTKGRLGRAVALLTLAASVGCVDAVPVVRLRTAGALPYWVSGHETVAQTKNGISVASAFERGANGQLSLRVEVFNQSDQRVDVDPKQFWFNHCSAPQAGSCAGSVAVQDPERVLEAMDQQASNKLADAQNEAMAALGMALLFAVVDVGEAATGHEPQDPSAGRDLVGSSLNAADRAEATARDLDAARERLAVVALRKTTLFPGRGVAGQVYIPVNFEAPYVRLNAQVGNDVFVFLWRQERIDGRPPVPVSKGGNARLPARSRP